MISGVMICKIDCKAGKAGKADTPESIAVTKFSI